MPDEAAETTFQNEILAHLCGHGWRRGKSADYDRERALYPEDVVGYFRETQPEAWQKFSKQYPADPEKALLDSVGRQLSKADPNATGKALRRYGTLGVLRHPIKDRGVTVRLAQFKPDHDLNPDTMARYAANRLRVVPELVYSPYANYKDTEGTKGRKWRIDLVLFLNGIPVATFELKSEFKQACANAVTQYKKDRPPKDPGTNKPEPLLTFKRGALVHFAVSQYEVMMCTRLAGKDSYFLPFNKGTAEGAAGNDAPEDGGHATGYLWEEVLERENLLQIIGRYIHLEVKEEIDWEGRKFKKETLIFPRYHQWDVVRKLIAAARAEGPGGKYLVQHSAGSGKSNSIAWVSHQLASLYLDAGDKLFRSVIVVTDRTVLDDQLQETIHQFEHSEGVVGRISREEGEGTKSQQLAKALLGAQPIIIVTIQTFPFVLDEIRKNESLKNYSYAIIADEAHSSQTGSTARKLREVLMAAAVEEDNGAEEGGELSAEDMLDLALEARGGSKNLSYFAFTATPKAKTLELFGRVPDPSQPPGKDNLPAAFHVYSMRQAIEEGFILDVLRNYITYGTAYQIAQKNAELDEEVDSKKASKKLATWVKLHPYNIGQRVRVIVEHFRSTVRPLLNGQAKAMVVTSSRLEATRYKTAFDTYIKDQEYTDVHAMVAFSGEVNDPEFSDLPLTERNMNPGLKGRNMPEAFDTGEYQVMIVAEKFQTGFDQPKLCAMYVLKKLAGVACVQTLSRLNRTYPGKKETGTFILDFLNDPDDIIEAFQPYYRTASLTDVSDPNQVHDLFNKLGAAEIYTWAEVESFASVFFTPKKVKATLSSLCKPAKERWQARYLKALQDTRDATKIFERCKKTGDAVLMANSETDLKDAKGRKDELDIFKKDLGSFARFYEFISQVVSLADPDLEKLNVYARHLLPLLREERLDEDDLDLDNISLTHYRLQKQREQDLRLQEEEGGLEPGSAIGSGSSRDKKVDPLSIIIARMNDLFAGENLTDGDLVTYFETVKSKVQENAAVMAQIRNNTRDQIMLGDYPKAADDAVIASDEAHTEIRTQYLSDPAIRQGFMRLLLEELLNDAAS